MAGQRGGYVRNDYPFGAVSVPIAPPVANKFWGERGIGCA